MCLNNQYCVPEPVLLNCLKHHAGYVSDFIRNYNLPELKEELTIIGKSQMDFYTGTLSPEQITEEITSYLKSKNLLSKEEYLNWISPAGSSCMKTRLSDSSVWIFLPGKITGRHVHIHPGKYSPFTLRVRSETLKTAIAVLCYCNYSGKDHSDLDVINKVRTKLLELSPVKKVNPGCGLGKMIEILTHMPPYGEIK